MTDKHQFNPIGRRSQAFFFLMLLIYRPHQLPLTHGPASIHAV